ncbi:MAG: putative Multi-sensor signal transduction histidine kinase [Candidatus Saccharibacteria bacterium]|nr:putative Multi-sensor signal transduction histidine kinase [Candidatus Saccharibacteria bacterium]
MRKGGVMINERTAYIMRLAGLMMPIILVFYGILVQYGIVDQSHYAGDLVFFSMMIPWVLLASFQYLLPSRSWRASGIRFAIYHVLSAFYILLISGFATPFIATWVLLLMASYAYFARFGLVSSVIVLILTATGDSILHLGNGTVVLTNILAALAVMIVGFVAIALSRVQEVDGAELSRSKALETLQSDRILTIVNNLADAVLSTDQNGIIRVYNAASLNLLDTNSSLNGHHIDEVLTFRSKDNKPFSLFDNLKKSRGVVIRDDLTMAIEDEVLRLEVTYSPIRSSYSQAKKAENQDGYILILRDITKAKSLEEERDEFISVVSHELRTPITIAEGTISNVQLMMERPDISDLVLKQSISTAHDQVIFLAKMVNDLSTLSRAERGVADTPELIEVRTLVDDLYKEYAPQAEAKGLHFNLDVGTHLGQVTASSLYLRELLQNFITNSIKYTKEGSVTLNIRRKDDKITFEVRDTGIGISKSDQGKIFNKFYRSEDYRTRETGGTGLGLYVAAKLAKKLGAKIGIHSRLNHGSSFSFTLSAKKSK